MPSKRPSWTLDPDMDGIDLDPSDFGCSVALKRVPNGDIFSASRAGDVDRLRYLLETGVNVNARDRWDSVALYYASLAGHLDAARMLLESGAICSEHTFDGDRCHYAALNLKVRKLLKAFEARPPPLGPLQGDLRETFLNCEANRAFLEQSENHFPGTGIGSSGASNYDHFPPDVTFFIHGRPIEAHRVILSARSPFFKKKFESDWKDRREVRFSRERYTDSLKEVDPDEAEEMFDAASRYLFFPLKRAVADVLLPHLEMASPAELCQWLMLSDMYGVLKMREYCLDTIACNFETFADTREFRAMLLTLPPPSGDSSHRTTVPSAPGAVANTDQANLLDDLREKWLEAEAAELDKRDESALLFDKRLEMLMLVAKQEKSETLSDDDDHGCVA
ncbi:BTB/POZ domain-containing protein At2g04740 isoform X4 [Syzygium oleosum]|uniref:BTB/POZ domain-containing protein At2g04740 isoform X4 n=1 Tax=Syzygium oleosum TaxID=219896 RepID=UPI0024BB8DA6|nr:BTB/POZ domain-containing protein At2g04740 isoform X4 [Syzygium oleosum]